MEQWTMEDLIEVKNEWKILAQEQTKEIKELKEKVEQLVSKLDVVEDELLYAFNTGDDSNRDFYIKNAIRFIREAMEILK